MDILNQALELSKHFSIIPVRGKIPIGKWKQYQKTPADEAQIRKWFDGKDINIGIVTGKVSNLSIVDIDDKTLYNQAIIDYGDTPIQVQTGKGYHLYYQYAEGVKNRANVKKGIDVRSEGGYVVAPGSTHESGAVYAMRTEGCLAEAVVKLPQFPREKFEEPENKLDLEVKPEPVQIQPETKNIISGARNDSITKAVGRWAKAGLKFDDIYTLAYNLNAKECSPPLGAGEVRNIVTSIYGREQQKCSDEAKEQIASIENYTMEEPGEVLLNPPGLVGEICQHINSSKVHHIPIFSVASSLAAVGAMLGLRVQTQTGLLTNIYTVGIADSGTGKNAPFEVIPPLIVASAFSQMRQTLGPTELTSAAALIKHLSERGNESCIIFKDEFGHFLEGCKRKGGFMADIPQQLTKLWSGERIHKQYAKESITVEQHSLSLFASSTGESYWRNISSTSAEDGNLARFLVVESNMERKPLKLIKDNNRIDPTRLVKNISALSEKFKVRMTTRGNLMNGQFYDPLEVPFSDKAIPIVEACSQKYVDAQNNARSPAQASIYARVCENAMRVSLIVACGDFRTQIEVEDFEWALTFVELCVNHTIKMIEDRIAKNDIEEVQNKIIITMKRLLKKNNNTGVSMRDITRGGNIRGVLNRTMKDIVDAMLAEGRIVSQMSQSKSGGRPVELFFIGK